MYIEYSLGCISSAIDQMVQKIQKFEISKNVSKFGLNCIKNDTFYHKFGLKMNF